MDGTLTLSSLSLAFADPNTSSNPRKKYVDWQYDVKVSVSNPRSQPYTVEAGGSLTLFNGARSISADGTTQWTLALSSLASDRYRFTATAGTAPALRTARAVALNGQSVIVAVNANLTASFTSAAGQFSAVQVGDEIFIKGTTTGDSAGPFNVLNEGRWSVLSVAGDGSSVQVERPTGVEFAAYGQTVSVTSNTQLIAYTSSGVQIGDGVTISSGFATTVQKTYEVVAVTPTWFEVVSTSALPVSAVAIPGASGILFYTDAKRYLEMFYDQSCVIRLNGDSSDYNRCDPWEAADSGQMGNYKKVGAVWQAVVVNKSTQTLNIEVITAE